MSTIESKKAAQFIIDEKDMSFCRDNVIFAQGYTFEPGMVLGRLGPDQGAVTVGAPTKTGTGNGTLTKATPAYGDGVVEGTYKIECTTAAENGGTFTVKLPDDSTEGTVEVGAAYDGTIKFTIADGSEDFIEGDYFEIVVSIADTGLGQLVPWVHDADSGAETVAGIAIYGADTTDAPIAGVMLARGPATVNLNALVFDDTAEASDITTAVAALMALGIRAR